MGEMQGPTRKKLWAIGGGKGGIGKSIITSGLGISLARLGKQVILIDGDLGGANLHTLMGVRYPHVTLEDFLLRKVPHLEDVVIPTSIEGIGLICGSDDVLGSANPTYGQKLRLLHQIEELPADFILLDLGAGTSFNILDFFNYSAGKIAIFTSQSTSLQNAYGFIKSALYRKLAREFARDEDMLCLLFEVGDKDSENGLNSMQDLLVRLEEQAPEQHRQLSRLLADFQLYLVVNMVKNHQDLKSSEIIQMVCADFLSLRPQVLGEVAFDPAVEAAVSGLTPFPWHEKKSRTNGAMREMAMNILKLRRLS